jgi:AbrB family looped-hinge helix DNA binding protein
MSDAKVTSKGQVTIPKKVRERLGVEPGDHLRFVVREDGSVGVQPLDAEGRESALAGWLNDRVEVEGSIDLEAIARSMEDAVAAHVLRGLE